MDFTKYVSMLQTGSLYFARPDKLGDPWEGSYAVPNISGAWERITTEYADLAIASEDQIGIVNANRKHMRELSYNTARLLTYINCWHMNEFESAAMWKLYLKSNDGIAVQSTFSRLSEALVDTGGPNNVDVIGGIVKYVDYASAFIDEYNMLNPFMYKRLSFQHEREFRALCIYGGSEEGIYLRVDLDRLIERVHVAPGCPAWIKDMVQDVTKKYGLTGKEVITSSLDERPLY